MFEHRVGMVQCQSFPQSRADSVPDVWPQILGHGFERSASDER